MSCRRWRPSKAIASARVAGPGRGRREVAPLPDHREDAPAGRAPGPVVVASRPGMEHERGRARRRRRRSWRRARRCGRRAAARPGSPPRPGRSPPSPRGVSAAWSCPERRRPANRARPRGAGAQRDGQSRQDGLGLGIAEARVALEQDRPVRGEHQAGVQRATERGPAASQLGEDRFVDRGEQRRGPLVGQVLDRTEGAHATRVRALVAVAESLVIAGDGQADRPPAIAQGDEARLASDQPLLDDDDRTRLREQPLDDTGRLDRVVADGHALAGGQSIRLDDAARPAVRQRRRERDRGLDFGERARHGPSGPRRPRRCHGRTPCWIRCARLRATARTPRTRPRAAHRRRRRPAAPPVPRRRVRPHELARRRRRPGRRAGPPARSGRGVRWRCRHCPAPR